MLFSVLFLAAVARSFTVSGFNSTGIGYELVTTNLGDINFNMQQLNSSQRKLSSEIQDPKKTLEEIKSLLMNHSLVEREKLPETCVEVPNCRSAKYSRFLIEGAKKKYLLKCLGKFSGNASDSLRRAYNKKFLTFDSDEDYDDYSAETNNCVANRKGAWWYDGCYASNLNGLYFKQIARQNGFTLMSWGIDFINFLKSSRMMIKATSEMNDDGSLCT